MSDHAQRIGLDLDALACDGQKREGSFDGGCVGCLNNLIDHYETKLISVEQQACSLGKRAGKAEADLSEALRRLDAFRCALESIKLEAGSHTIPRDAGNENPFVRVWHLANDGLAAAVESQRPSCRHATTKFDAAGQFRCADCNEPLADPRAEEERGPAYPTADAYEAACAALERHRRRADVAEARLRNVIGWRENDWPEGFCRRTAEMVAELASPSAETVEARVSEGRGE